MWTGHGGAGYGARMIVSVSWSSPFAAMPDVQVRSSDWGVTGTARLLRHHAREAWRLRRQRADVTVVTGSAEVILLCLLSITTRRRIAVFDFLAPSNHVLQLLGRLLLWRVDKWLVIRRGDVSMLGRRYRVPAARCTFVPFPAAAANVPATRGDYVYAAGIAHRDWPTFLAAMRKLDVRAIVSSSRLPDVPDNVDARELMSPEDGRRVAAGARLVVVPMIDTELPAGPLVVVDAQAAGKAVIASNVNGTRDYIQHGVTGWLVPPGNADTLAAQIDAVWDDTELLSAVEHRAPGACSTVEQAWVRIRHLLG